MREISHHVNVTLRQPTIYIIQIRGQDTQCSLYFIQTSSNNVCLSTSSAYFFTPIQSVFAAYMARLVYTGPKIARYLETHDLLMPLHCRTTGANLEAHARV